MRSPRYGFALNGRRGLVALVVLLLLGVPPVASRAAVHWNGGITQAGPADSPLSHLSIRPQPDRAATTTDGSIRRVNVPYFSGDVRFNQAAILWFGQVTPTTNYTDIRVGYNDEELWVHAAVFDRRLWYDTTPSPETLAAWDSVTLLIATDENAGNVLNASDYRFTGQLNWWEERAKWQAAWRGNGTGWSPASLAFTTASTWRGDVPDTNADDRGWGVTFRIPFASLGRTEEPPAGTRWGFAVLVHDRDDAAATPISDQKWPEAMIPESPATWGQLVFGLPSYRHALARPRGVATVRQGLNGALVPDAVAGGNSTCGSGLEYWTEWGNKNYAGLEYFNVQNQFDISDWPCFSKYYVTFPLDALPTNKTIISATLQLHQFGNAGAGWDPGPTPSYIQVLTLAGDWSETTLTWNNAPMAEQNVAGGWVDPLGDPVPPEGADRQWDVSNSVAEAYEAGRPLRLAVYSGDWDYHSGRYFRSSDYGDAAYRPTLIIQWGDPVSDAHRAWLPCVFR